MKKQQHGFTLIELMVVISILSILFSIMMPKMVSIKYRAQLTACSLYERNMATALENYRNDYPTRYPNTLAALQTNSYINATPSCPSNGSNYGYNLNGTGDYYTIYCNGTHSVVLTDVSAGFPQYSPGRGAQLR